MVVDDSHYFRLKTGCNLIQRKPGITTFHKMFTQLEYYFCISNKQKSSFFFTILFVCDCLNTVIVLLSCCVGNKPARLYSFTLDHVIFFATIR